jgi:phosphatidylinositol kinase/protein kinase (PI-3  family)
LLRYVGSYIDFSGDDLTLSSFQVMGGRYTPEFSKFARLLRKGFVCARKHSKEVVTLMEIMMFESNYPCFNYNPNAIRDFKQRLRLSDPIDSEDHWEPFIDRLIDRSHNSVGANLYDQFQLATNGIAV